MDLPITRDVTLLLPVVVLLIVTIGVVRGTIRR